MKANTKILLTFLMGLVAAILIAAPGDNYNSVMTDASGNIISTPLTASNQISMVITPTLPYHLTRYMDFTNGTIVVSGGGNVNTVSNNTFIATKTNTFDGTTIFSNVTFRTPFNAFLATALNLTNAVGNLSVSNLNSGTSSSATTFWRGDGTWSTPTATSLAGVAFTASNNVFTGVNTLSNALFLGSAITWTNNQPIMSVYSTNANQAAGAGSQSRMEFYTPAGTGGSIFGSAGSTNSITTGALPGDTVLRVESGKRLFLGNGSAQIGYWDMGPATKQLVILGGTDVTFSNNFTSANIVNNGYLTNKLSGTFLQNLRVDTNLIVGGTAYLASSNLTISSTAGQATVATTNATLNITTGSAAGSDINFTASGSAIANWTSALAYWYGGKFRIDSDGNIARISGASSASLTSAALSLNVDGGGAATIYNNSSDTGAYMRIQGGNAGAVNSGVSFWGSNVQLMDISTNGFVISQNIMGGATNNVLTNQFLTGSTSILTRGLGDARYALAGAGGTTVNMTNAILSTQITSVANAETNLVVLTFPFTNGYVRVNAAAKISSGDSTVSTRQLYQLYSVVGTTTNRIAGNSAYTGGSVEFPVYVQWEGQITATNTFILTGLTPEGGAQLFWGGTVKDFYETPAGAGGTSRSTNNIFISVTRISSNP